MTIALVHDPLESKYDANRSRFSQHCNFRNILCKARTSISNTVVRVERTSELQTDTVGVEFDRITGDPSRSSFIGGAIHLSDYPAGAGTNQNGSTAGIKVTAWWMNVDTTIVGSTAYGNEKGIWVPTAITGGHFYIRAGGFENSGDVIVDIDSASIKETTWVIECGQGDAALSIPAGWDNSNSITVIRETGEKTFLIPGKAY